MLFHVVELTTLGERKHPVDPYTIAVCCFNELVAWGIGGSKLDHALAVAELSRNVT